MLKLLSLVAVVGLNGAQALAADAAPPAPVQGCKEISLTSETEIAKYFGNGFKILKETTDSGTRLKFTGYVYKSKDLDCSKYVHIDLEHSNESHPGVYALHLWRSNVLNEDGTIKEDSAQCANKTKECHPNNPNCGKIEEQTGVFGENQTALANFANASGVVRLKQQGYDKNETGPLKDCKLQPDHPDFINVNAELPAKFGGPIDYKSPADLAKKRKDDKIKADNELVRSSCEDAKKSGSKDDVDSAVEIFTTVKGQKELVTNKKLFANLYLNSFETSLNEAKTADQLKEYIASIPRFFNDREHKYLRDLMLRPLIDFVLQAGKKGLELIGDAKSDKEAIRIYKEVFEASIAAARILDPNNEGLRLSHADAKLKRFQSGADTGSDGVYNQAFRHEFEQTYNRIANWYASNPRDPEVARVFKQYNDEAMGRTLIAQIPGMQYPLQVGYGTGLDQRYVTHNIDREFKAYRERMMSFGGANPQAGVMNLDGRSPSNSLQQQQGPGSTF